MGREINFLLTLQCFAEANARWAVGSFIVRTDRLVTVRQIEVDGGVLLIPSFQNDAFETATNCLAFHFSKHYLG